MRVELDGLQSGVRRKRLGVVPTAKDKERRTWSVAMYATGAGGGRTPGGKSLLWNHDK